MGRASRPWTSRSSRTPICRKFRRRLTSKPERKCVGKRGCDWFHVHLLAPDSTGVEACLVERNRLNARCDLQARAQRSIEICAERKVLLLKKRDESNTNQHQAKSPDSRG